MCNFKNEVDVCFEKKTAIKKSYYLASSGSTQPIVILQDLFKLGAKAFKDLHTSLEGWLPKKKEHETPLIWGHSGPI